MLRSVAVTVLLGMATAGAVAGQSRACPVPHRTVASFQDHLLEIAARGATFETRGAVSAWVVRALAPSPPPACRALSDGISVERAADELIRFVATRGDVTLAVGFFSGLRTAVRPGGGRTPLPIPMDGVRFAVERDTPGVIFNLQRWADRPEVREYLLELARAERGPAASPDLPAELVEVFLRFPTEEDAVLRAQLREQPALIRHPRARCLVESRLDPERDATACLPPPEREG